MQDASIAGTVKGPRIIAALIDYAIYSVLTVVLIFIFILGPASEESTMELIGSNLWNLVFSPGNTLMGIFQSLESSDALIILSAVVALLVAFFYFSFLPYKWDGQTVGKKLTHIKAINEDFDNPSLFQHVLRSVRVYDIYLAVAIFPVVLIIGAFLWLIGSGAFALSIATLLLGAATSLGGFLFTVSGVMLIFRQDAKGLHDMTAKTMVVPENNPFEDEK